MAETIQDTLDRLTAFIEQTYADVETGPGSVMSELLLKLAATLYNQQYNTISNLSQASTIQSVLASTETTYSEAIDMVASNYNTYRSDGVKVTGKIKVTVNDDGGYNIRQGLTFVQPALGLTYITSTSSRVDINPSPVLGELQLFEDNGLYYFILPVEATEADASFQISSGTLLDLSANSYISGFVKAEAYGNFSVGKAKETDKELIGKIKSTLGNTRFESPTGILNQFSSTFAGFQTLSVCGANDPEMKRSRQNIFGLSTFGKADVYVRSGLGLSSNEITKTATKISNNLWRLHIDNSDIPGFYEIKGIIPAIASLNLGGTLIQPNPPVFEIGFYPGTRNNEIPSVAEARFTKYQAATVTFEYEDKAGIEIDGKMLFNVRASYQPNIAEMQNLIISDKYRLACADYLVKAAVPCMVSMKINLIKKRPTDTYDSLNIQQLKKDIFTYVNSIPFGGELHASNVVDICHNYDIKRVDLPITMNGEILCPDGLSPISLTDTDVLMIPYAIDRGVTSKTTLYFIDYYKSENGIINPQDNIGINIT